MPSPIGHILSGILLYQIFNRHDARYDVRKLFVYVIISVIPDIDLAIGFLINDLKFHQGVFHSLGAAIFAGLIAGIVLIRKKGLFFNGFLLFSGLFYSHVILDYLASASDTGYPFGVALFWPFSNEYYVFPVTIFLDILRGTSNETLFSGMFNFHNLWAVMIELVLFLPLIILLHHFIFQKFGERL
ncbi:MAG: metal-dependent hydrolase [Candidatus Methanoperedens sp.]|nr:metal-dependent hydrolase [Candidatus Methanoperedens sp.]